MVTATAHEHWRLVSWPTVEDPEPSMQDQLDVQQTTFAIFDDYNIVEAAGDDAGVSCGGATNCRHVMSVDPPGPPPVVPLVPAANSQYKTSLSIAFCITHTAPQFGLTQQNSFAPTPVCRPWVPAACKQQSARHEPFSNFPKSFKKRHQALARSPTQKKGCGQCRRPRPRLLLLKYACWCRC